MNSKLWQVLKRFSANVNFSFSLFFAQSYILVFNVAIGIQYISYGGFCVNNSTFAECFFGWDAVNYLFNSVFKLNSKILQNSFCRASISAVAWSLSGEYVVSVDKSRRAVLWSDIWDQTWAAFFHLINWNHSWKCTQGCHQNTTLLGKAHTLHSVHSRTLSIVTVFVAKRLCHPKRRQMC